MSFTPASASFQFASLEASPPQDINFEAPSFHTLIRNIEVRNLPNWLEAYNIYNQGVDIYFSLRINDAYASTMQDDNYTETIDLRYQYGTGFLQLGSASFTVNLAVSNPVPLSLTPSVLPFQYIIGDPAPQNQVINVTSESTWTATVNQNWCTITPQQASNSGIITVSVDPVGLSTGNYQAIVTVQDAGATRFVTVTLLVTEGDTDSTFLYLTPTNVQFISEVGVANSTQKSIAVETSGTWSAFNSDSWLVLSATSGNSGITNITVSVDSDELTDTTIPYIAEIVFTSQGITKSAFVELILVPFVLAGIESENTYFADDRNYLQASNTFPNMFLFIDGYASSESVNLPVKKSVPFQDGIARVLLGLEANTLIRPPNTITSFSSRVFPMVKPINLSFSTYNKQILSGNTSLINTYSNVLFLPGKTPSVTDKFCYTPLELTLTKDAVLILSAKRTDDVNTITITGDVNNTIGSSVVDGRFGYSALINLSPLNLSEGNVININWAGFDYTINIKSKSLEQTLIAFENEWRNFEMFECTGSVIITNDAKQTTTELQVEAEKQTKIVDIDSGGTFSINTGWIYSQEEVDWLSRILESKRVFVYQSGIPIEVILTTKNLELYKTRDNLKSYTLKFKKAVVI